jgi:glyoxylase-like metal-dependent hydrolase (beta-lactamase superfamily II)
MSTFGSHATSRRSFIAATAGVAAAAVWGSPRRLLAFEEKAGEGVVQMMRNGAADAKLTVERLRGNLVVLLGSGGNITVLPGGDGKLLVDAGLAGSRPRITEALANFGDAPVKHLVNTHWHFDHCDGNEWLHEAGATIAAHENTRKHLTQETRVKPWDFTFPPSPKGAIPTVIVEKSHAIKANGTTVAIEYYGASAHTDGDLCAHFPDADVLAVGDTFWNGHYPFIDYDTGGSINGTIAANEKDLARVTDKTTIIPGHGPVAKKSDLEEFHEMLVTIRDAVAKLKKEGKSVEDVIAAKPTQKFDAKYGGFVITPDVFARLAYAGV